MGIFDKAKNKKQEEKVAPAKAADKSKAQASSSQSAENEAKLWNERGDRRMSETVIKKPRVTEKAAVAAGRSVYTFEVNPDASKNEIATAFEDIYHKTPVKVGTAQIPRKSKRTRFGMGRTRSRKKAMIYLKKGETIDFV